MSDLYQNMAQTALKQIEDKGRLITVITPGSDDIFDPDTFTFTPGTDEEHTVKGLFTRFAQKDIDGTSILRTDKRVLIAASSLDEQPETDSKIRDGSNEYRVINTEAVQPGDIPILYMVQVRK